MGKVQVGINGFGRIGRVTLRAILQCYADVLEVVAINDLGSVEALAHLLRYDSSYGPFPGVIETTADALVVDGQTIKALTQRDPTQLPWGDLGVDLVLECTGWFADSRWASAHLMAGARKVIISAPARNEDRTIVLGVNEDGYDPLRHHLLSSASRTMVALAPLAKAILHNWGIEWGFAAGVQATSSDQRLNDQYHPDLRRARAGAVNLTPSTNGAARAIGLVLPELAGKLHGSSMFVPTATVSCVDLTVNTVKPPGPVEDVNAVLRAAANEPYLGYTDDPVVSTDFRQDPRSSIMDLGLTMVLGERGLRVLSWYDNEWGYGCRVAELCRFVAGWM